MRFSHQRSALRFCILIIGTTIWPGASRGDIFQWEWVNPGDHSQGRQASTTLAPDGAGKTPAAGVNFDNLNLTMAYLPGTDLSGASLIKIKLIGAELTGANLANAKFKSTLSIPPLYPNLFFSDLSGANLHNADLRGADLSYAKVTGVDFSGAMITGMQLLSDHSSADEFSASQLYSTASYQAGDLHGIRLVDGIFGAWDFSSQNLTGASFAASVLPSTNFSNANLTNASFRVAALASTIFAGATIVGADFLATTPYGFSQSLLQSTSSYQAHHLEDITLSQNDLSGWDFSDQNLSNAKFVESVLTEANFTGATLAGADLTRADLRDATGLVGGNTTHAILPDATIAGLVFDPAESLLIHNYHAGTGITIQTALTMDPNSNFTFELTGGAWGSTLKFAPGTPVMLDSQLLARFADGVDPMSLIGTSWQLFDWTGAQVSGTSVFFGLNLPGDLYFDTSQLFTSGIVTLVPEPGMFATAVLFALAPIGGRRRFRR